MNTLSFARFYQKRLVLESTASISVNTEELQSSLVAWKNKNVEFIQRSRESSKNFNVEDFFKKVQEVFHDYPGLKQFLSALMSKNDDLIFQEQKNLHTWMKAQPFDMERFSTFRKITDYQDYIEPQSYDSEKLYDDWIKSYLEKTQIQMDELKRVIADAIGRIKNWAGEKIEIRPYRENFGQTEDEGGASASIVFMTGTIQPSFMIFKSEQGYKVDDVLEADDDEFFPNPQIKSDYFNLINEIRKPGSTQKGKNLTLYTARPAKDREFYLNSKTLPINVFLTNDYDHAEGLAHDLAGTEKGRDIWKVRVNSQYLTQTLDGKISYYQVTVDNAPAQLELITPAE